MTTPTTAHPDLMLDYGPNPHGDVPCPTCGREAPTVDTFAVATRGGPRLCTDCADDAAPAPMGTFAAALTDIDGVLFDAAPPLRPAILRTAMGALTDLAEYYEALAVEGITTGHAMPDGVA